MKKKLAYLGIVVALTLFAFPATAFAHDDTAFSCSLSLAVVNPGTPVMDGNEVQTTGEQTLGALDCTDDSLDGLFSTVHNSEIEINPLDGSFSGELEGTFTLITGTGTLTGEIEADISGVLIGFAPSPPFPPFTPIHTVTDVGELEAESGDVEIKADFSVTLVGVVGLPASLGGLAGGGTVDGELETDD